MGAELLQKPGNTFEFYESRHFFFSLRGHEEFEGLAELIKSQFGGRLAGNLGCLMRDIAVLLEGNVENPLYPHAFRRFSRHYSGFSSADLWDYARFLCQSFDAELPWTGAAASRSRAYLPSGKTSMLTEEYARDPEGFDYWKNAELLKELHDFHSRGKKSIGDARDDSLESRGLKSPSPEPVKWQPKPDWEDDDYHGWIPEEKPWDLTSEEYDEHVLGNLLDEDYPGWVEEEDIPERDYEYNEYAEYYGNELLMMDYGYMMGYAPVDEFESPLLMDEKWDPRDAGIYVDEYDSDDNSDDDDDDSSWEYPGSVPF